MQVILRGRGDRQPFPRVFGRIKREVQAREMKNLYAERRAVANELRTRLGQLIAQYTPAVGGKTADKTGLDPVLMERLKSLGHVAVSGGDDEVLTDRNLPDPEDRVQVYELVSDALTDSQHGRYAQGHEALGEIFLYQGKLDEAIASLRMALEIEPGYAKARQALVKALQAKGLHQEAEKEVRKGGGNGSKP